MSRPPGSAVEHPRLSVKDWDQFQHYKDRTPPWIKLYNDLLENYEFAQLPDASKAHLVAIWLLASRTKNRLPADPEFIANKINATEPVDLDILVSAGFLRVYGGDASTPLAERKQDAIPEREGEAEKETEAESGTRETRLPKDWAPTAEHIERARLSGLDLMREIEAFRAHAEENDRTAKVWNGAFTRWLINAEKYAEKNGTKKRTTNRGLDLPLRLLSDAV